MIDDLPVWTIRPNWTQGVMERLEWLTDVLTSDTGVEQRRSLRPSPRRRFEFTVNPSGPERTMLDLFLHRLGSAQWRVPLWHDQGRLGASAAVGATVLTFDNRYREHQNGGYALLFADAMTWEVVKIEQSIDTGLTLSFGTDRAWPRDTKIFPLRTMFLADDSLRALNARVGEAVLGWQVNEANDHHEGSVSDAVYLGRPVITTQPDRTKQITLDHTRLQFDQDGSTGLVYRRDTAGRAFSVQSHNWTVRGREAQYRFRSMLYFLRGRQRSVWLPSFNDDLILTRPLAAGGQTATIAKSGFGYVGGVIPGRSHFWTGREAVRHASVLPPSSPVEEQLRLQAPVTADYPAGACWGFLSAVRLDQDAVEIHHHADSDGVFECAAGFHTFADVRQAPLPIHVPIPAAVKSPNPCGTPSEEGNNCQYQGFDGWFVRMLWTTIDPCNLTFAPVRLLSTPPGVDGTAAGLNTGYAVPRDYLGPDGKIRIKTYPANTGQDPNGNASWIVEFLYDLQPGQWGSTIQYGAGWCGSVGKDETRVAISMQRWDQESPTVVVPDFRFGGNQVAQIDWSF